MKKITPYGNRFLVKRRPIGSKAGTSIILPDQVQDRPTDIADVIYVPDHTFADEHLLAKAEKIVSNLAIKAEEGDVEALKALLEFNHYVRIKRIRPGMTIMLGKYVGTDFSTSEDNRTLTMCSADEIIAVVSEDGQ